MTLDFMTEPLSIVAVSYLNTAPFVFGLTNAQTATNFKLSLEVPAECARKLLDHEVDVGLVPTFAILNKPEFRLISDFCIGAVDNVRTVVLLSNSNLAAIKKVYLDSHSRTSVNLIKVLAKFHWKVDVEWVVANVSDLKLPLPENEAVLAIGDKVFELENRFSVSIDLAKEWIDFTGLPMVFAVWVTAKSISDKAEKMLSEALAYGVQNVPMAVKTLKNLRIDSQEAIHYLTHNISYTLDEPKRKAIALFESYVNRLKSEI